MNKLPDQIIFWGGTGQAKVCRPIVEHYGSKLIAVIDDNAQLQAPFDDVPLYTGWDGLLKFLDKKKQSSNSIGFVITIGNPHGRVRLDLHSRLLKQGLIATTLIHPEAFVEKNAVIAEGSQVMAGAIIGAECTVGRQVIINTRASVDHETYIADGSEVAPGATLCGLIKLDVNSWICAGSTLLPRISVGHDAIVGAGSVVIDDVKANTTVVGAPAKEITRSQNTIKAVISR